MDSFEIYSKLTSNKCEGTLLKGENGTLERFCDNFGKTACPYRSILGFEECEDKIIRHYCQKNGRC